MVTSLHSRGCFDTLVSAAELQALGEELKNGNGHLIVLDARFNLADPQAGRSAYHSGHIPRAIYVDLDAQLSSPITPTTGRHPLPEMLTLSNWFGSVGAQKDKQIVVYDDMAGAMAARCWWLLKLLGYDKVAVLDGGFSAWEKAGFSVEQLQREPADGWLPQKLADWQNSPYAPISTEHVLANVTQDEFLLVDARSKERFMGEQEPIDPVAGHVPNAINRPLQDNLINGLFKPADQLRIEWLHFLNNRRPSEVVHMCGSGVTACHNLLAMEHAGLLGSKVYAGSWSEWIRDPQRPVMRRQLKNNE